MPPRKRKQDKHAEQLETPAGAIATDAGGRPLIDPDTGLPVIPSKPRPDEQDTDR